MPRNDTVGNTGQKWNWKRTLNIGTWNVRSLYWPGALNTLHQELTKLSFDIVAIQETRLGESGMQKYEEFTIFNSGPKDNKHELGVGFYVRNSLLEYIEDFKMINERVCYLQIKSRWFNSTLINVHAPTNDKPEEVKDEFYDKLDEVVDNLSNQEIRILLGDCNAKIGKELIFKPTIGFESLHEKSNDNATR